MKKYKINWIPCVEAHKDADITRSINSLVTQMEYESKLGWEFESICSLNTYDKGGLFSQGGYGSVNLIVYSKQMDEPKNSTPTQKTYTEAEVQALLAKYKKEGVPVAATKTVTKKPATKAVFDEKAEDTYIFGKKMMAARSYEAAYNTFSTIKGYKDVDELLEKLEEYI